MDLDTYMTVYDEEWETLEDEDYRNMKERYGFNETRKPYLKPLPKRITSIEECVRCFRIMEQYINALNNAIEDICRVLLLSSIITPASLHEADDLKQYKSANVYIKKKVEDVDKLARLIQEYIDNGFMTINSRRYGGCKHYISNAVKLVDEDTKGVERTYSDYNRIAPSTSPPIDRFVSYYAISVINFNRCLARWNEKFGESFKGARLPSMYRGR